MISLQNLLQWLTHKDHGAFDENSDRNAAARAAAHARVVARDRAAQLVRDDWIANAKANRGAWTPAIFAPIATCGNTAIQYDDRCEQDFPIDSPLLRINPANGLPMIDNTMIDVSGQTFGFCEVSTALGATPMI